MKARAEAAEPERAPAGRTHAQRKREGVDAEPACAVCATPALQPCAPGPDGVLAQGDQGAFMAQLRGEVTALANEELAELGRTADECPYIQRWLDHYDRADAAHLERVIERYARPEERSVDGYSRAILSRVRGALRVWKSTGRLTGIPDDAPAMEGPAFGAGEGLAAGIRGRLESAYGADLSGVRVHTGGEPSGMAQHLAALAFTVGSDIAFAPGMYRPGTPAGDALIAHEVAHTIQQGSVAHPAGALDRTTEQTLEREADAAAAGAVAGAYGVPAVRPAVHGGLKLQRCDLPDCAQYGPSGLRLDIEAKRRCGLLDPPFRPPGMTPFPEYRWEDDLGNRPLDDRCFPMGRPPEMASLGGGGLGGAAAQGRLAQLQPAPLPLPPVRPLPLPPVRPIPVPPVRPIPLPPVEPVPLPAPAPVPAPAPFPGPYPVPPVLPMPRPGPAPDAREDDRRYLDRLTPEQLEHYRWLREAEALRPEPGEEADDALPDVCPAPAPSPGEERERRPDEDCIGYLAPRRGGHAEHDAYATLKTGSSFDWYARGPSRLDIQYDGRTPGSVLVWEVKVRHGWFFNCAFESLREAVLGRWRDQKVRGLAVAAECDYVHVWACKDRRVARLLQRHHYFRDITVYAG